MACTKISSSTVELTIGRDDELDHVAAAARCAKQQGVSLQVTVEYRRPSARTLEKWRASAPEELRWRIHGATALEALVQSVIAAAMSEGVAPEVTHRELVR